MRMRNTSYVMRPNTFLHKTAIRGAVNNDVRDNVVATNTQTTCCPLSHRLISTQKMSDLRALVNPYFMP